MPGMQTTAGVKRALFPSAYGVMPSPRALPAPATTATVGPSWWLAWCSDASLPHGPLVPVTAEALHRERRRPLRDRSAASVPDCTHRQRLARRIVAGNGCLKAAGYPTPDLRASLSQAQQTPLAGLRVSIPGLMGLRLDWEGSGMDAALRMATDQDERVRSAPETARTKSVLLSARRQVVLA